MAKHECVLVPRADSSKPYTIRCSDCGKKWRWEPGRTSSSLLGGRDDTRMPDGRTKPKRWLTW